jgi:drug/metabolite transporter (DMT)-like permease
MRRPLDAVAIGALMLLCASWGLQQVAVKLALPTFPPMTQMGLRSAGASAMVIAWCAVTGRGGLLDRDGTFGWGLLVGFLFTAEFMLIYVGLQWTDASRSAVFLYTAPFFLALGARWLLPQERLGFAQWLGLLLSFAGVGIALGVPRAVPSARALLADLMVLAAGALWGVTTLAIKASRLRSTQPEKVLLYQLAMSAIGGALGAIVLREELGTASTPTIGALLYQTIWVAGITYVLWFRLLTVYPASPLQAGTSMTPLFGVVGAFLILGEPITPSFAVAAALVVSGLVLVNRR